MEVGICRLIDEHDTMVKIAEAGPKRRSYEDLSRRTLVPTMSQTKLQKPLGNYLHVLRQEFILFWQSLKGQAVTFAYNVDKPNQYFLFLILLVSIFMRLFFLGQPIRYDEAYTYLNYASKPLLTGMSNYSFPNNHLFHTILVHFSYVVFGNKLWALRLPALMAGVLTVPATYAVAYRFADKDAALLASGLVACSSILIEYSTNARGYTIICLLFLLLIYLAMDLYRQHNVFVWLFFAFISAIGFYTIPTMLYPYTMVMAWLAGLIWRHYPERRREVIKDIITYSALTMFITTLFYLPAIVTTGWSSILSNPFVIPLPLTSIIEKLPLNLPNLVNVWFRDFPLVVIGLLAVGFIGFLLHLPKFHYEAGFLAACMGLGFPVVFFVQRVIPAPRIWLFMLPMVFTFCSMGLSALTEGSFFSARLRRALFQLVTVVVVSWTCAQVINSRSIIYSTQTGTFKGAEIIATTLHDKLNDGDCVLTQCPSDTILAYYFQKYGIPLTCLQNAPAACRRIFVVVNEFEHQTLKEILQNKRINAREVEVQLEKKIEGATLYRLTFPQ
jgi:hypothetical protein